MELCAVLKESYINTWTYLNHVGICIQHRSGIFNGSASIIAVAKSVKHFDSHSH
jgi:hypothetical protein